METWAVVLISVLVPLVVIIILLLLLRKWIRGSMCPNKDRIDGKTVIITGANTGIGAETALELAARGARLVLACRNIQKAIAVKTRIQREIKNAEVTIVKLDLSSMESVRAAVEEIKEHHMKIDILINNAGVMACPESETADGFEMQLGTNHLGHFLFTVLLLDRIKASTPSRIINVSSLAHMNGKMHWDDLMLKKSYVPFKAYAQSKLANILFTKELAKRLQGDRVTTYAVHPGAVATELVRHIADAHNCCMVVLFSCMRPFFKSPTLGAQTSVYCAVAKELENVTGKYYSDCSEKGPSSRAKNMEDAARLWKESEKLVGLSA